MHDLTSATQGSVEPEAGWFDLFSSRYWKGLPKFYGIHVCDVKHSSFSLLTYAFMQLLVLVRHFSCSNSWLG